MKAVEKGSKYIVLSRWNSRVSILVLTLFLFSSGGIRAQVPSYVPKGGLLGWWPFNGNTNDESGNGNHGNAFKIVFDKDRLSNPNRSVYMSGNDSGSPSYIEIPSSNSLNTGNTSFTWSFWVRTNAVSTQNGYNLNHAILSKTRAGSTCDGATIFESKGYWISQTMFCNPGVNNYGQGNNVFTNDDKWHHIVLVVSAGKEGLFYIDNKPQPPSIIASFFSISPNSPIRIGRPSDMYWKTYKGYFDDFGFWNRALTQQEVTQLFQYSCNVSGFNPFPDSTLVCGSSTILNAGSPFSSYTWDGGATTQSLTATTSGWYKVTVKDSLGCVGVDSTYMSIFLADIVNRDTTICEGDSLVLRIASLAGSGTINTLPSHLRTGLVAYYPFNGNANDETENKNHGAVKNATLAPDMNGVPNAAYSFNPLSQSRITVSKLDTSMKNTFTYSFWVKPEKECAIPAQSQSSNAASGLPGNPCVIHPIHGMNFGDQVNSAGSGIYVGTNGLYVEEHSDSWEAVSISHVANMTGWHLVTVVYENKTPSLFIDGRFIKKGIPGNRNIYASLGPDRYGGTFYIQSGFGAGYLPTAGLSQFFQGSIDELSYYNRALQPNEVADIFNRRSLVQWSTGDTGTTIKVSPYQTTTYYVTVSNGITSCKDSVKVSVNKAPIFNPFVTSIYSKDNALALDPGTGYTRYRWSTGDTTQALNVKYTGGYRVTVTNASGCTASDSIFVQFPDTVGLHVSTVNGLCNRQVDVPVRATAFRHMLTMQGSVNWNAADLRLDSISGYGPASMGMDVANFGLTQAGNGRITFSWNDPSGNGLSLADSTTVFTLRFTALGTTIRSVPVTITSTPTPIEFFDAGLVRKSNVQTAGGVNITCEFTISGKVLTPLDQGVRNVTVTLTGGASPLTAKTDSAGNYSFKILPGTYTLTPVKGYEQNKTNGISTLDIALIQAHILQKTPFNASYKVIAGDANNSQGVTTGDILFLRKLILGTDTTLPDNRLWALVDGSQTFANPLVPFPFSSTKTFTNQSTDVSHTFRGIKIGDVNYDRNPLLDQAPSGDTLRLFGEWIDTEDGYVTLKVKSRAVSGLLGWQSTLRWDAKQLQLHNTTGLINNLGIGERWKDEGYLTLSWNDPRAEGLSFTEGSTWMELRFRKTSALQRTGIGMTEEKLGTEAFNDNYQSMGVKMEPVELRGNAWNGMMRVYPNPAGRLVNVEWKSARTGSGQIRLVDAQGRVVYQREASVVQGLNKARIEVPVGLASGSFVVQVHMGDDVNTASVLIGK